MRCVLFRTPGAVKWLLIKESRLEDFDLFLYIEKKQQQTKQAKNQILVFNNFGMKFGEVSSNVSLHTGGIVITTVWENVCYKFLYCV